MSPPATVVVATRDRRTALMRTLGHLRGLAVPVVVVDNGSVDGTADAVRRDAPWAELVEMGRNAGAAARTTGARRARTPLVAFCDDDSHWEPQALPRAADHMRRHPRTVLVAGRVLVGAEGREDPVSAAMAASPLPPGASPGTQVLGFLACAAVVRRDDFLAVGGFDERLGVGGEEELLSIDLAARGGELVYLPDVVARHHPPPRGDGDGARRRRTQARNALWCAWLRRPLVRAAVISAAHLRDATRDAAVRGGMIDAVRRGRWVPRERRAVAPALERRLRLLDA